MSVLILGGTQDALHLAGKLQQKGIAVIYSLAGLVRTPIVDYPVITGGFSQHGGLERYINTHAITGLLDATHPYANNISDMAYAAAIANHIPYWRFDRPAWQQQAGDHWFEYSDWNELLPMLEGKKSLFITTGRLDLLTLNALAQKILAHHPAQIARRILLRSAVKPDVMMQHNADWPENFHWIQAIGPFALQDEIALMREYAIDALISKNSGGDATIAKLHAARQLGIPVYLLKRPPNRYYQPCIEQISQDVLQKSFPEDKNQQYTVCSTLDACEAAILHYFKGADAS